MLQMKPTGRKQAKPHYKKVFVKLKVECCSGEGQSVK
jgi:hypothetical protein